VYYAAGFKVRIRPVATPATFLYNADMKRVGQDGFTIPELLVAIGLLVVLLVTAAVLLRTRDFGPEQRNAQRRIDAAQLVRAVAAYQKANGKLPSAVDTKSALIGSASEGAVNICADLLPHYLKTMPSDPLVTTPAGSSCDKANAEYVTGYAISKSADGQHFTVIAALAEAKATIAVTH
jgi:prepilin-type N-terminal cleavage/methylation domain-containing protein